MIFKKPNASAKRAFSLVEVIVCVGILGITVGAIVYGYNVATYRAEWSANSLAAHALAMQRMEQMRGAGWFSTSSPPRDHVVPANFPTRVEILDTPVSGTNFTYATNVVTIVDVSASPPIKLVRVDCTWAMLGKAFTNTIVTYRSPND